MTEYFKWYLEKQVEVEKQLEVIEWMHAIQ